MVLRVEDTDVARSTPESEAAILESLRWCGIDWDEGPDVGGLCGPYRQSERLEAGVYQAQLDRLVAEDKAYRCFLTEEELAQLRAEAERSGTAFVVESPWAQAKEAEVQAMLERGAPFVWRFRVPLERELVLSDLVLGDIAWNSADLGGDFVIVRSNGVPLYNFGVVVDDADMGITHVFRAQEHLMNTPKQLLLYEALGLTAPAFGHMPLILAPDRSKLSKRHGAVSVGDYQREGYLPSGMVNYLAQLGWNDGTNQEIFSTEELVEAFSMDRMSRVAAIFDSEKLKWVNSHHIRRLSDADAVEAIGSALASDGAVKEVGGEFVRKASLALRERISVLSEAGPELRSILAYDLPAALEEERFSSWLESGALRETARCLLEAQAEGAFSSVGEDPDVFKRLAKRVGAARGGGVKGKALFGPIRLCLTSSDSGPDMAILFDLLRHADENVLCDAAPLEERLAALRAAFDL